VAQEQRPPQNRSDSVVELAQNLHYLQTGLCLDVMLLPIPGSTTIIRAIELSAKYPILGLVKAG